MVILVPSAKVAARWHGALEARLRQAPLEAFLRSRGQVCALGGETRVTDNIAAAAVYFAQRARDALPDGQIAVGPLVCAVSDGLAALVREPTAWRIAALVAIARVLAPSLGLGPAADVSAAAVREYSMSLGTAPPAPALPRVRAAAAAAVQSNDERQVNFAVRLMTAAPCIPLAAVDVGRRAIEPA